MREGLSGTIQFHSPWSLSLFTFWQVFSHLQAPILHFIYLAYMTILNHFWQFLTVLTYNFHIKNGPHLYLWLGNIKDMESPPHNLIELLICKLLYWTLYIWHLWPFLTIFTSLIILTIINHFCHFWPFSKLAEKLPKPCPKLAQNLPETCPLSPCHFLNHGPL